MQRCFYPGGLCHTGVAVDRCPPLWEGELWFYASLRILAHKMSRMPNRSSLHNGVYTLQSSDPCQLWAGVSIGQSTRRSFLQHLLAPSKHDMNYPQEFCGPVAFFARWVPRQSGRRTLPPESLHPLESPLPPAARCHMALPHFAASFDNNTLQLRAARMCQERWLYPGLGRNFQKANQVRKFESTEFSSVAVAPRRPHPWSKSSNTGH